MSVQARLDQTNFNFVLSGQAMLKDSITLLQDAGRAAVLAIYTLLARLAVIVPAVGTADAGNTGDGTVTAVAGIPGIIPRVGTWLLTCVDTAVHGGTFSLTDPGGNVIRNNLVMTAGAGVATIFTIPEAGLVFTITDGAADFILADEFAIAITASGKYVPFDPDGVNGAQIPAAILLGDSVTAAALVAGDVTGQVALIGGPCTIDSSLLVIENGATVATGLAGGQTVADALATIGIFVEDTIDIDSLEN